MGTYLNGAAFAHDAATRLLLGRLLAYDAQLLAWMRGLSGAPAATGLPNPLSLEAGGRDARPPHHDPELPDLLKGPCLCCPVP